MFLVIISTKTSQPLLLHINIILSRKPSTATMKFPVASVLALATVAIAAPTKDHGRNQCNYVTCVDSALLVVDADIDLLGLLDIGLHVGLLENKQCKAFYCCPERCNEGEHIPDTCWKRQH
ncbi:hypothetical protein MAC_07302 [Metarhizium acridum CQMa 102]|uniref:Uncharacterized protein n=1 Tax=Metarhizium acridum (strain CQMa 102) TaxID=655827 RepID=E9EBQ4_METAQ|nr:uncharacterized protein MAC_07302 [Metarhizium acridum CQMa 102]EFY86613.1 hypothetical protein MAC_07302 [Metarhizium acridum CQMa 102]